MKDVSGIELRIGSMNVGSLRGKGDEVVETVDRRKLDTAFSKRPEGGVHRIRQAHATKCGDGLLGNMCTNSSGPVTLRALME